MTNARESFLAERGMILITVMLLLSLLMAAGMGAVVSVQNDLRMTANLRGGTAASYLADAGIEWGKQRIGAATTMPPILSNASQSLPPGSYSVAFLSSAQSMPLSATVVLRSVGSANNATQAIHARVAKTYDLADGAIVLRGNARGINFAGASFAISGLDHDLVTGVPLSGSRPRAGITVSATAVLNQLDVALDTVQRAKVAGDDGSGVAIALSQRISGNDMARIASDLCAAPNVIASAVPSLGSLVVTNQAWGNRAAPQLNCVTGLPGSGDSVVFAANTGGAGILVVRDAELVLTGDFRWEGWIVVSGSDVGFRVAGGDNKEILGALIIHESGNATGSGPAMLDIQGSLHVVLSRQAFNLAAPLVPAATLSASYASLPFLLKQDYWRSISP
jgi:Tfp pilus assembly protein PilX